VRGSDFLAAISKPKGERGAEVAKRSSVTEL
jgi:hypothetical protein